MADILSKLPLELVYEVFDHLPPFSVLKLALVCKSWNDLIKATAWEQKVASLHLPPGYNQSEANKRFEFPTLSHALRAIQIDASFLDMISPSWNNISFDNYPLLSALTLVDIGKAPIDGYKVLANAKMKSLELRGVTCTQLIVWPFELASCTSLKEFRMMLDPAIPLPNQQAIETMRAAATIIPSRPRLSELAALCLEIKDKTHLYCVFGAPYLAAMILTKCASRIKTLEVVCDRIQCHQFIFENTTADPSIIEHGIFENVAVSQSMLEPFEKVTLRNCQGDSLRPHRWQIAQGPGTGDHVANPKILEIEVTNGTDCFRQDERVRFPQHLQSLKLVDPVGATQKTFFRLLENTRLDSLTTLHICGATDRRYRYRSDWDRPYRNSKSLFEYIARSFPNLRSLTLIDQNRWVRTWEEAEAQLRRDLPSLEHLEITYHDRREPRAEKKRKRW